MLPLAPPSPRASRRSRRTLRRLSGSFLRRATPCEVAGGPHLCRRRSAGCDRVSGVEGGDACWRRRLRRHEPRGGGRDAPCGVSRGYLYGVRRRVRSPAARNSLRDRSPGPAALAAAMDLALSGALPVSGWVALSCQACYMAPGDCLAAGGWLGTLPKLHRRPGGSSRPAPRDRLGEPCRHQL